MAIVRKHLSEIIAASAIVDYAKLASTTDADIRSQQIEDGEDPDAVVDGLRENLVRRVRHGLGLTAEELADLTQIPVADLRNWEQLRTMPDPAARSLLGILRLRPDETKAALLSLKQQSAA